MHAICIETQTDSSGFDALSLMLQAEIESQKTTIRSLKMLLDQHKDEINCLQQVSTETIDKKENYEHHGNLRIADLERKFRFSETKVVKLAAEVRPATKPNPLYIT